MTSQTFKSINPATGEIIWEGPSTSVEEIDRAFSNAKKALETWGNLTASERAVYLDNFGQILRQNKDHLAETISKETGKPLWEGKNEVEAMINKIGISLESYGRRCTEMMREAGLATIVTRHRPHGVIGVFGPFNFPAHLPNGHIIPALLAGNTILFKPSELTPLVAQEIFEYWKQAQLPDGVLTLVQGGHKTGRAIVQHPLLNGLFFTGSYKTGKILSELFGSYPEKILVLEMGGNNPLIIGEVSNLHTAAFLTILSAFLSSGQRCTCARRLIVPNGHRGDQFIQILLQQASKVCVGAYTDHPEPFMGPVISESQALQLLAAEKKLQDLGGNTLLAMKHLKSGTGLLSPGLMDVTAIDNRPDEEFFGPFLQIIRVKNLEEAIEVANQTKYGLSAGLLSDLREEYNYFYSHIQAGIINWNTQLTGASSIAPFGGIKCSGNHRPSAYYAADYCAYPVASMEAPVMTRSALPPGLSVEE